MGPSWALPWALEGPCPGASWGPALGLAGALGGALGAAGPWALGGGPVNSQNKQPFPQGKYDGNAALIQSSQTLMRRECEANTKKQLESKKTNLMMCHLAVHIHAGWHGPPLRWSVPSPELCTMLFHYADFPPWLDLQPR